MNKTESHSNTPAFSKNESNTKPVLYQHPTAEEMKVPFIQKAKVWGQDIIAAAVILTCISTPIFIIRGCADEVDRQHAQAVQYQAQFGSGK